jgi:CRP-like cAMP-binding protein
METAQYVLTTDLRRADIFAGLPDDSLEQIASLCSQHTYKANEYCATQGKTIDNLMIVNSGKVAIEMLIDVPRYSHTVTIATLTQGNICAWSALVPPHILTASLKCLEDTQMIFIKGSDLQRVFEKSPSIGCTVMRNLAGVISSRLRDSHTQLTRVCGEIIKEAIKQGK